MYYLIVNRSGRRLANQGSAADARRVRRTAFVVLTLFIFGAAAAGAPPESPPPTDPGSATPPGGLHYQVLPGTAEDAQSTAATADAEIAIFLPRPPLDGWDSVAVTSDSDCLELGSLDDPGPGFVLVQAATAVAADFSELSTAGRSQESIAGVACDAIIRARFTSPAVNWETSASVRLYRPSAPPYPYEDLTASLVVSRIGASDIEPGAEALRVLFVELNLRNLGSAPLELLGLVDALGLEAFGVSAYLLPEGGYFGTVNELLGFDSLGSSAAASSFPLAPDQNLRLGLVIDPEPGLPRTAGALTVQPSLVVRRADEVFTVLFDRVSTSWGEDLP